LKTVLKPHATVVFTLQTMEAERWYVIPEQQHFNPVLLKGYWFLNIMKPTSQVLQTYQKVDQCSVNYVADDF